MTCSSCGAQNPANMRYCGMCGAPLVQKISQRERRRVSVVFIDLAKFSTLTHGFDPEELRDLADEVLTVVAGVIENYDGHVDSFRGDGLIALFGAPHSHPDDPQRAVLAAAAGLRAIEEVGRSRGYPLKGRAGVNTGIVIAGAIGSGRVRDYTVMGSTVNLAARIEAAAEAGEVWVGPETYESTRHLLLYEATGPVELAGFPNIRQVYRLVSTLEQHQVDPYAHLTFVGREGERSALLERFARVRQTGRPHEVWLVGEAGSGKTRLLRELVRDLEDDLEAEHARIFWIEGKPTESFRWRPLARQLFGIFDGEEERLQEQKVTALLDRLLPEQTNWHRLILTSLDLAKARRWTRLERRAIDRTNVAWADLMAAVSRSAEPPLTVLLIVENNPQDANLLQFLELLQETSAPILVIRTSRGRAELPDDADIVQLEPLNLEESLALLNQLASPVLQVATQSLVFQVGGVPAYILELGRALSITQSGSFSGSLASLLQARLDMLEPRARHLLSHAALTGERCWEGLLRELAQGSDEERASDIEELTRENLLVKEASSSIPDESEYRFQSELLRHAVLRMIPFADRPLLHLRIASWLEQHAPLALAELTGHHFHEGGSHDSAYPHYLAAADQALQQNDAVRAFELFERLVKLELPAEQLAQGTLAYAQAAISLGQRDLAVQQLSAADQWIEACSGDTREELRRVHAQLCLEAQAEVTAAEVDPDEIDAAVGDAAVGIANEEAATGAAAERPGGTTASSDASAADERAEPSDVI